MDDKSIDLIITAYSHIIFLIGLGFGVLIGMLLKQEKKG